MYSDFQADTHQYNTYANQERTDDATVESETLLEADSVIAIDNPTILYHCDRIEKVLGSDVVARALLEPLVDYAVEFSAAQDAAALFDEIGQSDSWTVRTRTLGERLTDYMADQARKTLIRIRQQTCILI